MPKPNGFVRGSRSLAAATAVVVGVGTGCAAYGPGSLRPGDSEAMVQQRMGAPTESLARPDGGHRLVYARGPMGQHTWMMDIGRDGRLVSWHQALEPQRLARIQPGMSQAEVRSEYGPPAEQRRLAFEGRSMWAWRFPTYQCEWFVVTWNQHGRVLDAGAMTDPRCDVDRD